MARDLPKPSLRAGVPPDWRPAPRRAGSLGRSLAIVNVVPFPVVLVPALRIARP